MDETNDSYRHERLAKERSEQGIYAGTATTLTAKRERGAVEQVAQELGLALEVLDMSISGLGEQLTPVREQQSRDNGEPDRTPTRGSSPVALTLKGHLDRIYSLNRRVKEMREEIEL